VATNVHPTAVVDPRAQLADGVEVGPFAVLGPDVVIGEGTVIHNHVTVTGHTRIGAQCRVFPGAVVGSAPQDLKYKGSLATLEIGEHNIIRECCTLNPGTELGGGRTVVGHHNLLMAYVHVAHDCRIEDHVVIANSSQLAGHVHIYEGARISGLAAIHQFVRIGRCSYVAGCAKLSIDVPPFTLAEGHPARIRTLNLEGLRRRGLGGADLAALKKAFRLLFRSPGASRDKAYAELAAEQLDKLPVVAEFVKFVQEMDRGVNGRGLEAQRTPVPPEQRDGSLAFQMEREPAPAQADEAAETRGRVEG
jgi:UDP-N-acetylglucosamine acyltransferase